MFLLLKYPETLMWYSLMLVITIVFAYLAQRNYFCGYNRKAVFYLVLLMLLLALFSGCRAQTVGVDTPAYYRQMRYMYLIEGASREIAFYGISFFISSLLGPQAVVVFWALIINVCIILRIWDFKDKTNFTVAMVSYYILWYFQTFSGIRQWAAVAILFYMTRFLFKKNRWGLFCVAVVACTFIHVSSIIAFYYVAIYFYKILKTKKNRLVAFLALTISVVPIVYYLAFSSFSLLRRYDYVRGQDVVANIGFQVPIMFLILVFVYIRHSHNRTPFFSEERELTEKGFMHFETINILVNFAGYYTKNIHRVRWYFGLHNTLFYGYLFSGKNRGRYFVEKVLITIVLLHQFLNLAGAGLEHFMFFWQI